MPTSLPPITELAATKRNQYARAVLALSHLIAASVYAGAAFLFGMALGERGELGFVQHLFTIVIPVVTVVFVWLTKQGRVNVMLTGLAMLIGLLLGQQQFERAWDDCLVRAETVRQSLLARDGEYPARLEDLDIELPCRCGFRTTILHYLSNDRGFRLWFNNDRERIVATDRKPFSASGKS